MSLAYFPLYPTDFNADTGHLSLAEDGAYNRLLRLQWGCPNGKLPGDMAWIFRRARAVTPEDQAVIEGIIAEFFIRKSGKIYNARLLKEFCKAQTEYKKRVAAGSKGGRAKHLKENKKDPSNATAELEHSSSNQNQNQNQNQNLPSEDIDVDDVSAGASEKIAEAPEALPPTDRERILAAMGVGPDGVIGAGKFTGTQGDMAEVERWMALPGINIDVICAEVERICRAKRDGPPFRFSYFTDAIRTLSGQLSAPPLTPAATPARTSPAASRQPSAEEMMAMVAARLGAAE